MDGCGGERNEYCAGARTLAADTVGVDATWNRGVVEPVLGIWVTGGWCVCVRVSVKLHYHYSVGS